MSKQTAGRHKTAVRHARVVRPRRHGKLVQGRKTAPKVAAAPATALAEPNVIEVLELDFVNDPDEVPAEVAFVTGLEDEDL